jgi:DNA-binding MarR family transcriptional regulator
MEQSPCICTNLRQAAQASTGFYDAILAPSGLKVTMYRLLRRISETPDITITDLADELGLDRSTLGRNLRVLARQDLVVLGVGRDERARRLTLTPAGKVALARARPLWAQAQTRMTQMIGADVDTLLQTLNALVNATRTSKGHADAD